MSTSSPITAALFSQAYTPQQQDLFGLIDTNGDGQITPDELTSFGQNLPGGNGGRFTNPQFFQKIDSNGDGAISKQEWAAYRQARQQTQSALLDVQEQSGTQRHRHHGPSGARQANPGQTFNALDLNKDGVVSPQEWAIANGTAPGVTTSSDVQAVGTQSTGGITGAVNTAVSGATNAVNSTVNSLTQFLGSL